MIPNDLLKDDDFVLPFQFTLLTVTGFFTLALLVLLYMQTANFWYGKTTSERIGRGNVVLDQ